MNSQQEATATLFRQSGQAAVRSVAGETILVPIRAGIAELECVFTLDEVAKFIWQMLETPRREDEIVAGVVAEFEVTPDEARQDVAAFLADLQEARLVAAGGEHHDHRAR